MQSIKNCLKDGCTFRAVFIDYQVCANHIRWYYQNKYQENDKKYCSNIIRGCFYLIPLNERCCNLCLSKAKILDRERHRSKNINMNIKRDILNQGEEYNNNNYIYKIPELCLNDEINNLVREKWKIYIYGAVSRNIPWEISFQFFKQNIINNCYYCKDESHGFDRINHNSTYSETDIIPCCSDCNKMKGKLDQVIFLGHVARILLYQTKYKNIELNINEQQWDFTKLDLTNKKKPTRSSYCFSAKKRNIEWGLTNDEFKSIYNEDCHYCGHKSNPSDYNGVDRYDNTIGYIVGNCVSACEHCNFYKSDFSVEYWISKLIKIWNNHSLYIYTQPWIEAINPYNRQM